MIPACILLTLVLCFFCSGEIPFTSSLSSSCRLVEDYPSCYLPPSLAEVIQRYSFHSYLRYLSSWFAVCGIVSMYTYQSCVLYAVRTTWRLRSLEKTPSSNLQMTWSCLPLQQEDVSFMNFNYHVISYQSFPWKSSALFLPLMDGHAVVTAL